MIYNKILNVSLSDYKWNSCTLYIVLFVVFLIPSIIIGSVFIRFQWYLKKNNVQGDLKNNNVRIKFNPGTQTTVH